MPKPDSTATATVERPIDADFYGPAAVGGGADSGGSGSDGDGRGDILGSAGSDTGDGGGTVKRGRGRPRKQPQPELVREVTPDPVRETRGRGKAKSPSLQGAINAVTVGVFNLTAILTQHQHWLKDAQEVQPITDPLNAWIDQLPAKQLKKIEAGLLPVLLGVGLATVLGPDIVMEMRLRANARLAVSQQATVTSGPNPSIPFTGGFRPDVIPGYGSVNGQPARERAGDGLNDDSRPPQVPGIPI